VVPPAGSLSVSDTQAATPSASGDTSANHECGCRPGVLERRARRHWRGPPRVRRTGRGGRRSPRPANSRMQGSRICPPLPAYRGTQPSSPDCAASEARCLHRGAIGSDRPGALATLRWGPRLAERGAGVAACRVAAVPTQRPAASTTVGSIRPACDDHSQARGRRPRWSGGAAGLRLQRSPLSPLLLRIPDEQPIAVCRGGIAPRYCWMRVNTLPAGSRT
jgi:hypothetical protein